MQQKDIVKKIRGIVGEENVLTDEGSLHHYGVDWTKHYQPNPMAIVFPRTIAHVQAMVKLANDAKIPLVPSGGRTGYSGGAVASHNEVVVSFSKMNKILDFNPIDRMVVCQPGVINQELQQFVSQHDLFFPINLASSGSCEIGGNISTNAGGIKVIRYGATRDWVAGLKVVTGKGDLLDCNKGLIKNATGYDLRQLFIGAEGTLGFVVEATMRLTTKPQDLNVIVLGLVELDAIMEVLHAFRQKIELTAFEFFSDKALEFVIKYKKLPPPFETRAKYYALIEYERNHEGIDDHVLRLFEYCMERGWVIDGTMSQNGQQFNNLWHLREYISETIIQFTPCKFDLSVKVSKMPEFLHAVDAYLQKNFQEFISIWFGHIGDGNLHLNILKPADEKPETFFKTCEKLNVDIFKLIKDYEGAISAEHGIGLLRKHYLTDTRSAEEIKYMRAIQQVFDPNGIMNPGKIFD